MTQINVTNVADLTVDVDVDMVVNMAAEVYNDVTTHLFMGQYQKCPT
jgi:hypothetical protein